MAMARRCYICDNSPCSCAVVESKEEATRRRRMLKMTRQPTLVAKLSEASTDAKVRSLRETLDAAIDRVESGSWQDCDGLLILAVEKKGSKYFHGYERAGLHHSDSVTLLEVTKHAMLKEMEE